MGSVRCQSLHRITYSHVVWLVSTQSNNESKMCYILVVRLLETTQSTYLIYHILYVNINSVHINSTHQRVTAVGDFRNTASGAGISLHTGTRVK